MFLRLGGISLDYGMGAGLVSVLVPCFNMAEHLPMFMDSLLNQTYKLLEVILVNDGSTDRTAEIFGEYLPRLEAEGYSVKLVHLKNGGVASAIDSGLKHFTGEFLTWPDPDDCLTPNSIAERVRLFHENPTVGLVRCNAEMIEMGTGRSLGCFDANSGNVYFHKTLFSELAHIRTYFAPVCYMVRTSMFLEVNPGRSIYVTREAMQNLQMLLPVSYRYECLQTEAVLGCYYVRKGSLSRRVSTLEDAFRWDSVMCEVTMQTLSRIKDVDNGLIKRISRYLIRNKLLPGAFRAQLKRELFVLVNDSGLGDLRRALCIVVITLRCSHLFRYLTFFAGDYLPRAFNKLFCLLVRF